MGRGELPGPLRLQSPKVPRGGARPPGPGRDTQLSRARLGLGGAHGPGAGIWLQGGGYQLQDLDPALLSQGSPLGLRCAPFSPRAWVP
jgi:hypothetical protein